MRYLYILFLLILLGGCTQYKKIVYLQSEAEQDSVQTASIEQYKLKQGDLLHIRVYSPDPQINEMFNLESGQARSNYNDISLYLDGFQLDDNSQIELPVIGKIDLNNRTMAEARAIISDSVNSYISDANTKVKLLSYKVTVFGEVSTPGVISVYRHQSNIYEVLSMAGDVLPLGNRTDVEVLRPIDGGRTKLSIDLTQMQAMNHPAYNIYPNDIIYVKPHKAKVFRDNIPIISLAFSTLTTFLLILNYFQ